VLEDKQHKNILIDESQQDKNRIGYIRISSAEKNEQKHIEAFSHLGLYKIYIERVSIKDPTRPILQQMLDEVKKGCTVYIGSFARLARSIKDFLNIVNEITQRDSHLISLKESFDTMTDRGRLIIEISEYIHEFERENMLQRQREGIQLAKSQGKFKGRKEIPRPQNWDEIYNLYRTRKMTGTQAMIQLGLKRNTFYKFVKKERENE